MFETAGSNHASSTTGARLEDLLAQRSAIPASARSLRKTDELPLPLEQLVRDLPAGTIWRAYGEGARLWMVFAREVCLDDSGAGRQPALAVNFYDESSSLCGGGAWRLEACGDWRLVSPVPQPMCPPARRRRLPPRRQAHRRLARPITAGRSIAAATGRLAR